MLPHCLSRIVSSFSTKAKQPQNLITSILSAVNAASSVTFERQCWRVLHSPPRKTSHIVLHVHNICISRTSKLFVSFLREIDQLKGQRQKAASTSNRQRKINKNAGGVATQESAVDGSIV